MEYIKPLNYKNQTMLYSYNFLDIVKDNVDVRKYYSYLDTLNKDNIYYNIRIKWHNTIQLLSDKSIYRKKKLPKYYNITNDILNEELHTFIKDDPVIAIFVMNIIQAGI